MLKKEKLVFAGAKGHNCSAEKPSYKWGNIHV
jgi:hypothetical protein